MVKITLKKCAKHSSQETSFPYTLSLVHDGVDGVVVSAIDVG